MVLNEEQWIKELREKRIAYGISPVSYTHLGYNVDKTVYPLTIKAGETATLKVSDTPKVTDTLIELFKMDMETQKDNPQGNASLAGAEFTWKYYACLLYTSFLCVWQSMCR